MTEQLNTWLQALLAEPTLAWDTLGPEGGAGLYSRGRKELWRRTDIVGKTLVRIRQQFTLKLLTCRGGREMAAFLTDLARQAEQTAPTLGGDQLLRVENARQTHRDSRGQARYELDICFEFTEGEEHE